MRKTKRTNRGFEYHKFKDRDGKEYSIQESSVANEDAIWFGLDELDIKEFFPIPRDTEESWFDITSEDLQRLKKRPQNKIHVFSRMHLTRKQVKEILPILQNFVDNGDLSDPSKEERK